MNEQDFNVPKMQSRAHDELSKRARGGIVIYLLAWLVVTLPSGIHLTNTQFFYLNSGILISIMLVRPGDNANIEFHMIAAAAVLGIAGTATLSIARESRFLYSPFITGPLFIALVTRGSADD